MSDAEYIIQAERAYKEALDIVRNTEGWSIEKEDKKNQVIVKMKKNAQGRKIYLCTVSLFFNLLEEPHDLNGLWPWRLRPLKLR